MRFAHLVPVLALALSGGGCFWTTTKSEGQAMRRDIDQLQSGLGEKQKQLDSQIAQLKTVLDDATKLLKRNSADLGADVDALRTDVAQAKGLAQQINNAIAELKSQQDQMRKQHDARLDALEQRIGQLESGKPSANSSPEDLWKLGSTAFEAGRYNDAIEIFKRLHTSFPTHERADDAIYFKGQAYTNLKDWEKAIGSYQQLVDKFPDGALTDDGLYFAALAAQQLKQCGEARAYLQIIKTKHPKSNVIKQANELETQLKKDAKNKSKCSA
ncbi:MAG TPA: tetratricopeptide repeat protein [Kofleriaceae bacterium]|nr:tetratricopeptide repeat protein [Kofleriaceae bacterium]